MKLRLLAFLIPATLHAGPYAGVAGPGSPAVSKDDSRIVAWASGHSEVTYGVDVDNMWRTPEKATGKATTDVYDIVCLGNGGQITMYFPHSVRDGAGADFAVFENSFSDTFLELAFVEVSSDGVNFFRFPSASLTPSKVGPFDTTMDPTNIDGLAGKYRGGYGTPFDLASLPDSPLLNKQRVAFVRIIDIIGDGKTKDSSGRPIYDPTPVIGSGGFDLDAIGVIHINDGDFSLVNFTLTGTTAALEWQSNPGQSYRIESGTKLDDWQPVETVTARTNRGTTLRTVNFAAGPRRFWRVVRTSP
ncbi:hypothetical protein OKA04_17025 [Luteolibacter flavescens]|uniref:PEP-CTERM sorting domain-containing protein n=1 Tax=Luteolibacter flavescens TaxID=1859460 RepID=A0ABT3FT90_9BACT|nr:hypothetical protein [Luteolibacter flavescens]MCW1886444.1 hypothetical protein [Luteolibacter flavescens]